MQWNKSEPNLYRIATFNFFSLKLFYYTNPVETGIVIINSILSFPQDFLAIFEEILLQYYMGGHMIIRLKSSTTHWCVTRRELTVKLPVSHIL